MSQLATTLVNSLTYRLLEPGINILNIGIKTRLDLKDFLSDYKLEKDFKFIDHMTAFVHLCDPETLNLF